MEVCTFLAHNIPLFHWLTNVGGKSAVLSAITVALGGKTASTGRGSGLKSFIREGQKYERHFEHIEQTV